MAFAIHRHESAMSVHVFPILNPPPIPLGDPSAPALSTQSHASNLKLIHIILSFIETNLILPGELSNKKLNRLYLKAIISITQDVHYCL